MFEETNQTTEIEMPDDLFGDTATDTTDAGETVTDDSGETVTDEGAQAETDVAEDTNEATEGGESAPKADDGGKITIKYNGEEREITLDEARTLAQKGMNYDHVHEELERNREIASMIEGFAKKSGVSVAEYVKLAREASDAARIEEKVNALRATDEDASDTTLRELAKAQLAREEAAAEKAEKAAEKAKSDAEVAGWQKLFTDNPELVGADGKPTVPPKVFDYVKSGMTPTESYFRFKAEELENENKTLKSAKVAEEKSVGSVSAQASPAADDFLSGFLGG